MSELVYLNEKYLPLEQACVPVLDRGFMFGDGVYEVIPVYGGRCFRLDEHIQRLHRSLDAVDMPCPQCVADLPAIIERLIENNIGDADGSVYLQVTRGVMPFRDQGYRHDMTPTVLVMAPRHEYRGQRKDTQGIRAVTLADTRWADCHIKSTNLLPNVLQRQTAIDAGADEAILLRDQHAIEGTTSNLFIVKDDILRTPPQSRHMLGGITREVIIELCHENYIVVQEKPISEDALHDADEIWLTSSTREIMPVTTLNLHAVGKGVPGPHWLQMIDLYQAFKQSVMRG
jgi:D-alanine transaminase